MKTCVIDAGSGLCLGCFRSLDEIAAWGKLTPEERRSVMAALPDRAARLGRTASTLPGD